MSLLDHSLSELGRLIKKKEISPVELTEASLQRIERTEPVLNAFVIVTAELARSQARQAEAEIRHGLYRGPLHGIPYAAKDLYDTAGMATTSSSKVHADHIADADAVTVKRLRDAGMILLGKTHTHEFAYGALTLQSGNPWNPACTTGGSSGGSGAAVAAGVTCVALGTDTGGSVRVPAAVCGTVGLKPTYGAIPRTGITPLSWSLDTAGVLTRNVIDAALVFDCMRGGDPGDPSSIKHQPDADVAVAPGLSSDLHGCRVGVPTNYYTDHVHEDVAACFSRAVKLLESLGADVIDVQIPYAEPLDFMSSVLGTIAMAEMAAFHAPLMRTKAHLYTDEVRVANQAASSILAADYVNALRWRAKIKQAWRAMYEAHELDVLIAPTVAYPAVERNDPNFRWPDGFKESGNDGYLRLTRPSNLTGLPTLQVPSGFTQQNLPVGVQIVGRPLQEARILGVGLALEQNTSHVGRIAPL